MMRQSLILAGAMAAALTSTIATTTHADTVIIEPESRTERVSTGSTLVGSGLVTFGIAYGAAAIVASTSDHPGDHHLFIPIAGPWMDIASRGPCGPTESRTCDNETVNKVLLGVDGVFQALGAITFVSGILSPDRRTVVAKERNQPHVTISPASYGKSGAGLVAVGTF